MLQPDPESAVCDPPGPELWLAAGVLAPFKWPPDGTMLLPTGSVAKAVNLPIGAQ